MNREHQSFYIFLALSALERHRSPDRSSLIALVSHLRDRFHQALGGVTITCPLDIRREDPANEHSRLIYEAPSGAFGGVGDYFCLASLPLRGRMLESWCFMHISVGSSIRRSRIRVIDPVDDVRGQTREVINDWLALSENPLSQIPDDAPDGEVTTLSVTFTRRQPGSVAMSVHRSYQYLVYFLWALSDHGQFPMQVPTNPLWYP